ncbi:putative ribosome quality control (RQC) complex YloA/Tae2 family protein [Salibacterium salarium]|uniref:Rqc2 family fibronectin-binding protein n=1 Tax=Salibacterium salarium TaxID=284579 RepID=UPI00278635C2|nr:NFACT RNA binding domain-containing protein [Salibacterium salarium]MDQ0299073.1 putative ribosome quality control (RQC) complex YloA/Tae2 family protein [Salibacterium salarium]
MSFDGIMTKAVIDECKNTILSGRITKIKQPYKTDLLLTIRANQKNHQLLLSANPSFSRMHFTDIKVENPKEPPMFCMLLRKHIEGGFIREIRQDGMERVVTFVIEGKNELGDTSTKHLVVEIMGKHSNIMLIEEDTNLILDSMKHLPPSVNRHRTILPGREYVGPPSQDKLNPLEADEETIVRKLDMNQGKLDRQLVQSFNGISPQTASEVIHRTGLGATEQKIASTFLKIMEDVIEERYAPVIIFTNSKEYYSVLELGHIDGKEKEFESVSRMLDRFHSGKAERDRVKQRAHDLERLLRNEWQKNKKKIKKLEQTEQRAEKSLQAQKLGELLTANLHLVKGGETELEVIDYYDENAGTITIELDAEKSPSENAQVYFRQYNKAKKSLEMSKQQIEEANAEMKYLEQLIQQLESAAPSDIEEIREELSEQGYIKKRPQKGKKKKKPVKPVLEKYISSDGTEMFVGKNNKQNEYLTSRVANRNDMWLHTKDIPGSHVVIQGQDITDETLLEAANIAAFYSKAKESSSVPVDYTKIKHVHKPNGAKPGFVTYDNQSTVFVTPDQDLVTNLRASK